MINLSWSKRNYVRDEMNRSCLARSEVFELSFGFHNYYTLQPSIPNSLSPTQYVISNSAHIAIHGFTHWNSRIYSSHYF